MKLSIIIVSFNTKDLLDDCLTSVISDGLDNQTEIIVVDNASKDDSLTLLRNKYPQVKVIKNTNNCGFGVANNQGAKKAAGEWLLLLNSDTQLKPGTLTKIQQFLLTADSNSVYGCQLKNKDNTIQPSAGFFPTLGRVTLQMFFLDDLPGVKKFISPYQQSDTQFYLDEHEVDWVTGAFFLVRKENFMAAGGFDESIFMYGEEVELCRRLKKQGMQVIYSPFIDLYHFAGGSSIDGFFARVRGEFLSLLQIYRRDASKQFPILKIILFLGALLRIVVFGMIRPGKSRVYKKVLTEIINY